MSKRIIIQSGFNVMKFNLKLEIDEEWIKFRLKLFTHYALKSLKAQTNQDFIFLLRCRDETIPLIKKDLEGIIPENVFIVGVAEFHEKVRELTKDYDYLYLVRLDSDDMWVRTFVDMLHNYSAKPETEVLLSQYCYNYDIKNKRLSSFFYPSPQSYVLVYKSTEYAEGKRYHLKGGHGGAIFMKHEIIPGFNYMDTIHQTNTCSHFYGNVWKDWKEIKDKDEIKNILIEFGISGEEEELRYENKG